MDFELHKEKVEEIAKKYELSLVMLFGSYAEGRQRKDSDIDIAYLKPRALSLDDEIKLAYDLQTLFRIERADVVYIGSASPLFMYMILQKGKVLYETGTVYPEIYTYSIKRYQDNLPLYQMRFEHLCKQYNVKPNNISV